MRHDGRPAHSLQCKQSYRAFVDLKAKLVAAQDACPNCQARPKKPAPKKP